ncbi:MAG: prolyl oligopeptidase family serine peptidase [Ferruginibacter sp.]|nr:prolyl oligopeptidase family serine peptidase [Ferruginibacter sp.]
MKKLLLLIAIAITTTTQAQDAIEYQKPPAAIYDLVMAKPSPGVSIDTKGEWMLIMERSAMPSVEELAQPELRIAGLRINPNNFGPSRSAYIIGLSLKNIKANTESAISGLPSNLKAGNFQWSPNEDKIAFTQANSNTIDLYIIDIKTKKATKVNKLPLNAVLGGSYDWYNNNSIFYLGAAKPASEAPKKPLAPKGPTVQQNLGKVAASVTYQDLIKSPYDEQLFEFYATSQLIKNTNGIETKIGTPLIYSSFDVSPDSKYMLIEKIDKPFSYLVTAGGFNSTVFVADINGKIISTLDKLPSRELAPTGYDNVLNAPRGHNWVNSLPNTVMWIEPQDSGLIKKKSEFRDAVYTVSAPFNKANANVLLKTTMRLGNVTPLTENEFWITESSRVKHTLKVSKYNTTTKEFTTLIDRSTDDAYGDPGSPIFEKNKYGKLTPKLVNGNTLLMRGAGASAKGDLPFLRSFNINTKESKEIWRCAEPYYESVSAIVDYDKMSFITSKQSQNETPNFYLYTNGNAKQITNFADPQPALRGVTKEKITYKRKDGVDLAADLYLPKGYDPTKDGKLPVIMWAYPREFKSSADAAQIRGSKYTFVRVGYGSVVFWVTQGYAVMDNAEFPIVGEGDKQPNDNFIEQLVWNAEAGINKIAEMGVGDSTRVAVGGHSYGAFMTTNLLAHCNLFKAGIARSGAYNRTLTPFGFQNEERTYWQAPELYFRMSPFSYANKIKTPLLMIHGEADNNPGTFPIQSERLYNAIKGHGGTVRFVQLPYESHGYAAKENILHMLWEQHQWLEKYVKGAK